MTQPAASSASPSLLVLDWGKLDNVGTHDGTQRSRVPIGDYRLKIKNAVMEPSKKADHVQLVVEIEVIMLLSGDAVSAGMTIKMYYAGSAQSPDFLQQRLHTFLKALAIPRTMAQLSLTDLRGRQFDGTVYHEVSAGQLDQVTGAVGKAYINERLCNERPCGLARTVADPLVLSAAAIAHEKMMLTGGGGEAPAGTHTPPWGAGAGVPPAAGSAPTGAPAGGPTQGAGTPPVEPEGPAPIVTEAEIPIEDRGVVSSLRVEIQMGTPKAAQAVKNLADCGYPAAGPIYIDDLRAAAPAAADAWLAFTTKAAATPATPVAAGRRGKRVIAAV